MKRVAAAVLMSLVVVTSAAATPVGPGDVAGTWAAAGGPYVVQGHLRVPAGEVLTIEPGVDVRFAGNYVLSVEGALQAVGTAADSIRFLPDTPGTTWGHIEFPAAAEPGTGLAYCRITGADARSNPAPYSARGGGLAILGSTTVTLEHCCIDWCIAEGGGGLYSEGYPVLESCAIRHCRAPGGALQGKGGGAYLVYDAYLHDCVISDCTSQFMGGGLYLYIFTGSVIACTVVDNQVEGHGGGIACESLYAGGILSGNLIARNSTGALAYSDGGGLFVWYSANNMVEGNTLVANTAPHGAGIAFGYASLELWRCLIAFNTGEASYDITGPSTVSYAQTCVWGNTGGDLLVGTETETLLADPLLCNAGGGDYALCADSPCLPLGIGALGQGCAACGTAVAHTSWSRVKSLY